MLATFLQQIDWTRPWLQPFVPIAGAILQASDWRIALNAAADAAELRNHRDLPLRFVPQERLPVGVPYEAFISETGAVPTRDNLHDFFNALIWLSFPRVKQRLNALQAAEIAKSLATKISSDDRESSRGKLRDAATIFDENATLVICSDTEWIAALRGHRWHDALFDRRSAFGHTAGVVLFGHALMEKLVSPYKAITAHALVISVEPWLLQAPQEKQLSWLDATVAGQLAGGLATGDFTPLPVLGVPGWWDGQDQAYYADRSVFRPKRSIA
jgi:hypothetical protein